MGYATELVAREWIRQRLDEAERERLGRPAPTEEPRDNDRGPDRPWRSRLTLAIGRRLGRAAGAS